jgi:hypothetical protein
MHGADYLAAEKPLIILSNYEANAGFFPLIWHYEKNPFAHLAIESGIEGQAPNVSLRKYAEAFRHWILTTYCYGAKAWSPALKGNLP